MQSGSFRKPGPSTSSVHAGEDREKYASSLTNPIFQTSTFVYENMAEVEDYAARKLKGDVNRYEYTRYGNPTENIAIRKLAEMEGAETGLLFATGMNAVTTSLLAFLEAGHHLLLTDEAYRKTREFCEKVLCKFGVDFSIIPVDDPDAWVAAIRPNTTVVFSESPTNPHLYVLNLEKFVTTMKRHTQAVLMIDATFATPVNQRPLEFGIDLVIHSCTKYLGGHNDLLAGAVVGSKEHVQRIKELHGTLGGNLDPHAAYLLLRGMKTLALRMQRHNANGQAVAEFLERHPRVRTVYYPGLPSHPHHEVARRQMAGFGGVVSFEIDGSKEDTCRFIDALKIPFLGPSLGGVESLVYHPAALTFADFSPEDRERLGLPDNLVRLAVGIEDPDDIIADLTLALTTVG